MDKFIYLGSSISSTENDINTQQLKARTAIGRLLVKWMSDNKNAFFQVVLTIILMHHMGAD